MKQKQLNKWLTVSFQPVSFFSLKRYDATNMAAWSNLVPTPYCIKMTLLKMLLEGEGKLHPTDFDNWIKSEFNWIRDLTIYLKPPQRLVVNRNGYKLRYYDQTVDKADKNRGTVAIQDGFVFREWIYWEGILTICCGETDKIDELESLFAQINYFGKRGCFCQYLPEATQKTPEALFSQNPTTGFTVQPMDDLGKKTTFNKINPFSGQNAQLGKDRVVNPGLLPLRLVATNPQYDIYERI